MRDLSRSGPQRQLQLFLVQPVLSNGPGPRRLLPTQSVSRDGVWDRIWLVVRSAALEPRAGTLKSAAPTSPAWSATNRLHRYMLEVEHIGIISDEMREVVEELWPELVHKLPPKTPQG